MAPCLSDPPGRSRPGRATPGRRRATATGPARARAVPGQERFAAGAAAPRWSVRRSGASRTASSTLSFLRTRVRPSLHRRRVDLPAGGQPRAGDAARPRAAPRRGEPHHRAAALPRLRAPGPRRTESEPRARLGRRAAACKRGRRGRLRGRPQRGGRRGARAAGRVAVAGRLLAAALPRSWREGVTFVAPDEGAIARCAAIAEAAGADEPIVWVRKRRTPTGLEHLGIVGSPGQRALVVDDILDTGGTLVSCCRQLRDAGVEEIGVIATHGLFTGERWRVLPHEGVQRLWITDTVLSRRRPPDVEVVPVAPLLAPVLTGTGD